MASHPPPKKPGASRGILSHVVPDQRYSDDDSLANTLDRRRRFAAVLASMPNVGRDRDFERVRYGLAELVARCDPEAPMPEDMGDWENMAPVGREYGAERAIPLHRARRELVGIIRSGESASIVKNGRVVAVLVTLTQSDVDNP